MRFVTFVAKNLLRRPGRSSLTVVGISLAVAAAVSLIGISEGFEQSYLELYNRSDVDLIIQRSGRAQQLSNGLNEELGDRIRRLPGVRQMMSGLVDVVSFEESDLYAVIVNGWTRDCPTFDRVKIISGRRFRDADQETVMLGRVLAANLGKRVGDQIELYGRQFEVIGIYESFSVYENGFVVMPLDVMQRLTDRPHEVSGFTVSVDGERIDELKRRIEKLAPRLTVQTTANFVGSITQIRMARAMAWVTSAVAVILGGIGVLNTMVMSVIERTRELGVLRAIGWSRRRVVRMILSESVLLSLAGAALGTSAGALLTEFLGRFPTTAGFIEGRVAPHVVVQGIAIALAMGLIGAAYPAFWSASLQPVDALHRK